MKQVADDFGTTVEDIQKRALRTRACLRPMSSDNIPIIGAMTHYPNVVLNVGYGSQGWQCFGGAKLIEDIIQPNEEAHNIYDSKIRRMTSARRMWM